MVPGVQTRANALKQEPDQYCNATWRSRKDCEFRQSQALVMTPQLMQAIKLLQLSNLDLAAYVEGELERNPLLERSQRRSRRPEPAERGGSRAPPERGRRLAERTVRDRPPRAIEDRLDTGLEQRFPDDAGRGARARPRRDARRPIRNGPASAPAAARTATTISRPSSRPRRRSPTISPSSSRSRSPIRRAA